MDENKLPLSRPNYVQLSLNPASQTPCKRPPLSTLYFIHTFRRAGAFRRGPPPRRACVAFNRFRHVEDSSWFFWGGSGGDKQMHPCQTAGCSS